MIKYDLMIAAIMGADTLEDAGTAAHTTTRDIRRLFKKRRFLLELRKAELLQIIAFVALLIGLMACSGQAAPTSGIGTRKNAAPIGTPVKCEINSDVYGKGTLEVTLVKVVRGQEAANIISNHNSLNKPAPQGKEFILADFRIKNIKNKSNEDIPLEVTEAQFSFASSSFSKEDQMIGNSFDNYLGAELYEGAETTGTVLFESDQGDACYAVYMDTAWFALS